MVCETKEGDDPQIHRSDTKTIRVTLCHFVDRLLSNIDNQQLEREGFGPVGLSSVIRFKFL